MTSKRSLFMLWGATAAIAAGTGAGAVALAVGAPDNRVLSQDDVAAQLAASSPTPTPSATSAPSGAPTATRSADATRYATSPGGTLTATCTRVGSPPSIFGITPAAGYRTDGVLARAHDAYVDFESDSKPDVRIVVTCPSLVPNAAVTTDQDAHGGNRPAPTPAPSTSADDHGGDRGGRSGGSGHGGGSDD